MKSSKRPRPRGAKPDTAKRSSILPRKRGDEISGRKAPRKNGILIFLVEDDQDHREALTCLLEEAGYDVRSARHGLEAIEMLRWGLQPSAILLDMRMHVMNGWEFRRELARDPELRSIPVFIMSGAALKPEDLEGCAAWIPKPVKGPELLKKLQQGTRLAMQVR